ncbi:glycosyltransferase family A protein [Bacillus thuringiensis]|nr:glycosyltransferase family A protein [Bacillus thuringiensis]
MTKKMYNNALVSVIMPCYNPKTHLKEAIDSVLNQTYSNLELIIVDDGSDESISEYIEGFSGDSRLKIIKNKENQGVARTRNKGLALSRGRYIAFLDSDDIWHKEKLRCQLAIMHKSEECFVYSAYEVINHNSSEITRIVEVPNRIDYQGLLKNTIIGCLTVLIDRKKVGDFKMPLVSVGEDTATWLNILKNGYTAYGIQIPLAQYRVAGNSLSSNKFKMVLGTWKMYRDTQQLKCYKRFYYFCFYILNAIKKRI